MRSVPLAFSAASRDLRGMVRRTKRNIVLIAFVSVCFGTAYLAGLAALGIYLSEHLGALGAALVIALGMIGVGAGLLIVLAVLKKIDQRRSAKRRAAQRLAIAAAVSVLPQLTNRKGIIALAALGGLALFAARGAGDEET
ncbi:hypothetical protein AB1P65_20865 [Roseibium alexandrii]